MLSLLELENSGSLLHLMGIGCFIEMLKTEFEVVARCPLNGYRLFHKVLLLVLHFGDIDPGIKHEGGNAHTKYGL